MYAKQADIQRLCPDLQQHCLSNKGSSSGGVQITLQMGIKWDLMGTV